MASKAATPPTPEEERAAAIAELAAIQKRLAALRLAPLQDLAAKVDALDLKSLVVQLQELLPLLPDDPLKMQLINFAKVLPALPENLKAAIKAAETLAST